MDQGSSFEKSGWNTIRVQDFGKIRLVKHFGIFKIINQVHNLKKVHADPQSRQLYCTRKMISSIIDFGCVNKSFPEDFHEGYFLPLIKQDFIEWRKKSLNQILLWIRVYSSDKDTARRTELLQGELFKEMIGSSWETISRGPIWLFRCGIFFEQIFKLGEFEFPMRRMFRKSNKREAPDMDCTSIELFRDSINLL